MNNSTYKVFVVVDPNYGERLRDLPENEPIWVVDSQGNHPTIRALWKERKQTNHIQGITSFTFDINDEPEDWLLNQLPTIDLHHGEMSHEPPYSALEVIGVGWSKRIEKKMKEFNLHKHESTSDGFMVKRRARATSQR